MADHIQVTSDNTRQEVTSLATIVGLRNESRTVKSLTLKVERQDVTFKAGQWVDMFIPGVSTVGGFSMCGSPCRLQTEGLLDLAIKVSRHPPAHWVHNQCTVGSQVQIRVGGDFFYDPVTSRGHDLLLIAGGVGINPLLSILNHVADLCKGDNSLSADIRDSRVMLLYSAQTAEELIFKDQIEQMAATHENIRCQFHVTREPTTSHDKQSHRHVGRITSSDLSACLTWLRVDRTHVYLCGPSSMLTDMDTALVSLGLDEGHIKYEMWW